MKKELKEGDNLKNAALKFQTNTHPFLAKNPATDAYAFCSRKSPWEAFRELKMATTIHVGYFIPIVFSL